MFVGDFFSVIVCNQVKPAVFIISGDVSLKPHEAFAIPDSIIYQVADNFQECLLIHLHVHILFGEIHIKKQSFLLCQGGKTK
ncbi:hypothetical protein SDC9_114873 [bioreactor metagenome]|uniref:Uncharacterized protein n=1 Tax=bioreactor metagenome TaxID=1076179 RepID=A0A645BS85_9ZZZZ